MSGLTRYHTGRSHFEESFAVSRAYEGHVQESPDYRDRFVLIPSLRKFTHEKRLRVASQISDRIVKKYGRDVLAVYVCGSTSKTLTVLTLT